MNYVPFTSDDLQINFKSQRKEYRERRGGDKSSIHWGQRKLLLSEIEFFAIYLDKTVNPICVYAGAAHGNHIPLLSELFPSLTFHLYDPSHFNIGETDKIKIYKELFTDKIANYYRNIENVFFISDIRTIDYDTINKQQLAQVGITEFDNKGSPIGDYKLIKIAKTKSAAEVELGIWADMEIQQRWVLLMNPLHCLLKFRLPWTLRDANDIPIDRKVKYLKGTVFWQQWSPQSSTETRLKPIKNTKGQYELANWSILEYEQWCFYQNTEVRENTKFLNIFDNSTNPHSSELLNDYDSTAEAYILQMYLNSIGIDDVNLTLQLSQSITINLNESSTQPKTLTTMRGFAVRTETDAFRKKPTITKQSLSTKKPSPSLRLSPLPKLEPLNVSIPKLPIRSNVVSPKLPVRSTKVPSPKPTSTKVPSPKPMSTKVPSPKPTSMLMSSNRTVPVPVPSTRTIPVQVPVPSNKITTIPLSSNRITTIPLPKKGF